MVFEIFTDLLFFSDNFQSVLRTKGKGEMCNEKGADPENKFSHAAHLNDFLKAQSDHQFGYRSGVSSLLVLKEAIETVFVATQFVPFDPFYELYYEMMSRLADGGFLSYWNDLHTNPRGQKQKIDKIGPQVLTIEHLMIGFQICLTAAAVSMIAFLAEFAGKILEKLILKGKSKIRQRILELLESKLHENRMKKIEIQSLRFVNVKPAQTRRIEV